MRVSNPILDFIAAKSRKGEKCAECSLVFTVDSGDGKVVAMFAMGAKRLGLYVLCKTCGADYKKRGTTAIPNACRDARITTLMSPHAPKGKSPVWIH